MFVFQPVPVQPFGHPTSFPGIYSEDDYVNDMAQRVLHDYAQAHARIPAFERQHDYYHHHPHHHQYHHGGHYRGRFAPASLDNFCYGFGPTPARAAFFPPNRRVAAHPSPEELAYRFWQEEERQRVLERRLATIVRQQELARERDAQRRHALAEAAAREQEARAAHAARAQARQARDQEVFLTLLSQLGLAVTPAQSAPVAPQVNRQQPSVQFTHPARYAAPVPTPSLGVPVDLKGKGKAVDAPVQIPAPIHNAVPVPAKVPNLKEELQARIRSETDPDVQESLVLLYSDLFDVREPSQPVAGPSGHKHVSFEVPISGPSSSASGSPVPVKVDTTTARTPTAKPETDEKKAEELDGASLHRAHALPPAVAAKLLKFYRDHRTRKLSLAQIKDVEDALQKLEDAFEFPAHLDFVDRSPSPSPSPAASDSDTESALAYTANNTAVHAYEHALNDLLTKLDAVESNGDLEVRGRRKEVVKEVERAIEAMERRIEESRERSRERTRRGSVSSQASDASVTVTPYNVHSSDNVDTVQLAVAVEEAPVDVTNEAIEAPVEDEDTKAIPDVEDSGRIPAATNENPEATIASPPADIPELESPRLTVGLPDSGADVCTPPPSDESIHSDPSSPVDGDEDFDHAFAVFSPPGDGSTPNLVSSSAVEEAAVPSRDTDVDVVEQESVSAAESDAQSTSHVKPSATDTALVTAPSDSVHPLPAADIAATADPSGPGATQQLTPDDSESTPSPGDETFLLASTPLADDQPRRRQPSTSTGEDEVDFIGDEEFEAARNGSDWSDLGSESDL